MMTILADELRQAMGALHDARGRLDSAYGRIYGLLPIDTLPAPALTEQAIVDALKADPAMAGRVIARFSREAMVSDISDAGSAAYDWCGACMDEFSLRSARLQSLAVALAAASYRG